MTTEITRRSFLTAGTLGLLGMATRPAKAVVSALGWSPSAPKLGKNDRDSHVLVAIFLRGGVDGLSVAAPYAEDDYYRMRPTLSLARPSERGVKASQRLIDLDGHFGLHPALAPLLPIYRSGELALIHACGSGDQTRSHFEAMATMERGIRDDTGGAASGWLARHLQALDSQDVHGANGSALRAVAIADTLPQSLAGATGVSVMRQVSDVALNPAFGNHDQQISQALQAMYGSGGGAIEQSGHDTLKLLRALEDLSPATSMPRNGAVYPKNDDIGDGLHQVAMLIRSRIGLEVACLDHMGYDTHVAQGSATGILADRLTGLAGALAAFRADLGPELWSRTTVTVQSEFGRRVEENSGLGTDHGRGTVMMVLGGSGVEGGRIWGDWPTLSPDKLEGPGDLHVTTDYRNVLAEVLQRRCGLRAPGPVFPGLDYRPLGILRNA